MAAKDPEDQKQWVEPGSEFDGLGGCLGAIFEILFFWW